MKQTCTVYSTQGQVRCVQGQVTCKKVKKLVNNGKYPLQGQQSCRQCEVDWTEGQENCI